MMIAGKPGSSFPRSVVGHRTLNGEDTPVVVNDDEEEQGGWVGLGHGTSFPEFRGSGKRRWIISLALFTGEC